MSARDFYDCGFELMATRAAQHAGSWYTNSSEFILRMLSKQYMVPSMPGIIHQAILCAPIVDQCLY